MRRPKRAAAGPPDEVKVRHARLCASAREARINADLTLVEMAEKTGYSHAWLSKFELGEKGTAGGGANAQFVGCGVEVLYRYEEVCGLGNEHGVLLGKGGYVKDLSDRELIDRVRLRFSGPSGRLIASMIEAAVVEEDEARRGAAAVDNRRRG